ncbi:MFS transporter [Streptomyces sp. NPDC102467]|uniref:MFS transporter n=1 Tax=Streptomyces sp. NPDC102467 TaxID=3366179 RepID=UPI0037F4BD7C
MKTENSVTYAEATAEPPDEPTGGWRTAMASTLGLACGPSVLAVTTFGAFIAPLHREFGWGIPAIGLASSILSITLVFISPVQGLLVDRFGGRRVILWSSPFFALSLMAMYFLPDSLPAFYLGWVLIPLCGLGLWPVSYLRLTAGWFERRLGLALGVANSGIGIGTVLVPILTTVLIGTWGWRAAYLGLGMVALIAFPVAYFLLAEPRPRADGRRVGVESAATRCGTRRERGRSGSCLPHSSCWARSAPASSSTRSRCCLTPGFPRTSRTWCRSHSGSRSSWPGS